MSNRKKPECNRKFCGTTVLEFNALYRIPIFQQRKKTAPKLIVKA